jgi:hypothetical protein
MRRSVRHGKEMEIPSSIGDLLDPSRNVDAVVHRHEEDAPGHRRAKPL